MPGFSIIAAAAVPLFVVLAGTPVSARSCERGAAACTEVGPRAPLHLNQFLKHSRGAKPAATHEALKKAAASKVDPAPAPVVATESSVNVESETDIAGAPAPDVGPVRTIETDGVAVTSADELNEIDALAGKVRVVAADELNEIDLAAPVAGIISPWNGQALEAMASADAPVADTAWIGQLLAAFAGTIAVASAMRLLIA